jgi:cytidylate kinase
MGNEQVNPRREGLEQRLPVIAIDGPAGAGKSTLAAHLARRFGLLNLESGAMYRALALKAIECDVSFSDEAALTALFATTSIELQAQSEGNRVLLDGHDVTRRVRERDVAEAASQVSVHPQVRAWMVAQQRALGAQGGVVMEGRDIGTKVFPDAEVKIFLDAAPEVRGQRRFLQSGPAQATVTEESVIAALRERDARDRTRATSPLEPAQDAILIDSTNMSFDAVMARSEEIVRKKLAQAGATK